jgi:hypothetical protein
MSTASPSSAAPTPPTSVAADASVPPKVRALSASGRTASIPFCEQSPGLSSLRYAPSHAVAAGPGGVIYALTEASPDADRAPDETALGLVKLDSSGKERWRVALGVLDEHRVAPWPIAVAPNGDVLVVGAFEGTIEWDGVRLASPVPSFPPEPKPYLIRLGADGALRFALMLEHPDPAVTTGLGVAADGTAYVAVSSTDGKGAARDGHAALHAVDATGRASVVHRFSGELLGFTMLPTGELAIAGSRADAARSAFISVVDRAGTILETLTLFEDGAATKEPLAPGREAPIAALTASRTGELWAVVALSYAGSLDVAVAPHDRGSTWIVAQIDRPLRRAVGAWELRDLLYGTPDLLATTADGAVVVGHSMARRLDLRTRDHPSDGWISRLLGADGQLHEVERLETNEGALGHADVAVATDTISGGSPSVGVTICARPCELFCRHYGGCTYRHDRAGAACVARSDAECAQSMQCTSHGACAAAADECVASSSAACRASSHCKRYGACTLVGSGCEPAGDSDCRPSLACQDEGRCTFSTEPGISPAASGPRCVASSDDGCRRARICRAEGRCFAQERAGCEARSSEDSTGCRELGRCSLEPRSPAFGPRLCLALSDADCRPSQICKKRGLCSLEDHAPDAETDPQAPRITACGMRSETDCRHSDACSREGKCRLVARACVP